MSRLKRFTHSLLSGYALMGVNVVYTLLSVPLALKYLTKAEFGLWAVTIQIAGYIALVDLGMNSSVARILIDHKDDRANGRYGGVIKSGFLVGVVQGGIALVVGLCLVWFLGDWLKVPAELSRDFFWLMTGQVILTASTFGTRIFGQILFAWQRIDFFNYAQIAQLVLGLVGLWIGFIVGLGVFSLLVGAALGWISGLVVMVLSCQSLRLLPRGREWGRASREQFRELFQYGADVFLITLGTQLVTSSQTVLISRELGMDAAALWSVMTKVFTLVSQVVWRLVANAMPAFAEMYVRKEEERMWNRFHGLFVMVNVLAVIFAVFFAACNGPFVAVWMRGQFTWRPLNDIFLGAWLIVLTQQCCHNSLVIFLKQIRALKYVFLIEGIVFVGVTAFLLPRTGITGMLLCSVVATTLFTWATGIWRVGQLLGGRFGMLLWDWQVPILKALVTMAPGWLLLRWIIGPNYGLLGLTANAALLGILGVWAMIRFGLPSGFTAEMLAKLPLPLQRPASAVLALIAGRSSLKV